MNAFKEKYGPWALITGASAGIGEEFAKQLAEKGMNLVLTARRLDKLEQLAGELKEEYSIDVRCVKCDLSDMEFMSSIRQAVNDIEIGLLINNAGFGIGGSTLSSDLNKELAQLNVHCRANIILTHEFGNKMIERKKGGIIFTSSVMGFFAAPFSVHYAATKAHNLFYGEGLFYELKDKGIDSQALCPGMTKTEFHDAAGVNRIGGMHVTPVVKASLNKLGRKSVVVPGFGNKMSVLAIKILPRRLILSIWRIIARKIGRDKTAK
ncbi:MAG: SDR family oxidoreductase [bacterium]|nr:SDR family oxidoreductase [bacterium]